MTELTVSLVTYRQDTGVCDAEGCDEKLTARQPYLNMSGNGDHSYISISLCYKCTKALGVTILKELLDHEQRIS